MSQQAKSTLDQCKQQCEQFKNQMSSQLNSITDVKARTAYQMAINAVDNAIAQCHTASGAIQ